MSRSAPQPRSSPSPIRIPPRAPSPTVRTIPINRARKIIMARSRVGLQELHPVTTASRPAMEMGMGPIRKILQSSHFRPRTKLSLLRTVVRQSLPQPKTTGMPCPMTPMRIPASSLKPSPRKAHNLTMATMTCIEHSWKPCLLRMVAIPQTTGMPLPCLPSPRSLKAHLPSRVSRLLRICLLDRPCKTSPSLIQTTPPMMISGPTIHIARSRPIRNTVGLANCSH